MDIDMSEFLDEFIEELHQLLDTFEEDLEKVNSGREDKEIIDEIFRAAHSIKGMSATMEFKNMESLTHRMEDLLDKIRTHELSINKSIINVLFRGVQILHSLLKSIEYTASEDDVEQTVIDSEVHDLDILLDKKEKIILKKVKEEIKPEEKKEEKAEFEKEEKKEKITLNDGNNNFSEKINSNIEKLLKKNKIVFISELSLDENSPLITARAFMVVSSIKNSEELITSIPEMDNFKNADFNLETNKIYLLFSSEKDINSLKEILIDLPEVNNVLIKQVKNLEELNFSFSKTSVEHASIEEEVDPIDILSQFKSDEELSLYLKEKINTLEIMAVDFSGENFSIFFNKILPSYRIIVKGIEMLGNDFLKQLVSKSLELIVNCSSSTIDIHDDCIDCFLDLLMYIRKFCENKVILENRIYKGKIIELDKKIDKLIISKEIKGDEKIGAILQKQLNIPENELEDLLDKQQHEYKGKKLGEVAIAEKKISSKDVINALRVQKTKKKQNEILQEQIRIPAQKADQLIDLLEELIMVESETEQDAITIATEDSKLLKNINKCFRITKEIQTLSISFRMITLHSIFQKVNMSARDAMKKLNKKIKIEISGSQTTIDRLVGNKIVDPLLHLIKNSISHGIETVEEREAVGKSKEGNVYINAYSEKGYVYISIADDGRGMNTEKLYQKALDKALIDPNKKFTEEEILNFIFMPGFSTAEKINKVSGRGVGMDVVKTEIHKLRGKISINNRPGKGCTTILRIPQNMTSLNGTVVKIKGNKYIIPSIFIKEVFKLEQEKFVSISGENSFVKLRDTIIPVINRDQFFQGEGEPEIMVVLDVDNSEKALPIDQVMERREIVVKPLGEDFEDIKYIFGASILGDGKAALILGIENLFKLCDEYNRHKN